MNIYCTTILFFQIQQQRDAELRLLSGELALVRSGVLRERQRLESALRQREEELQQLRRQNKTQARYDDNCEEYIHM